MPDHNSRLRCLIIFVFCFTMGRSPAASVATRSDASIDEGRALFFSCEYKRAARTFQHALASNPGSAELIFWVGKSYARMAEVMRAIVATSKRAVSAVSGVRWIGHGSI